MIVYRRDEYERLKEAYEDMKVYDNAKRV